MKVTLIAHSPDPERIVAAAAKLCYSSTGVENIMEGLDTDRTVKFLNMLMDLGHESPIEHVSFTFGIEGVSRVLTHQLVRHRIGCSYSQQSQRYVKLEQFEYIIPPAIAANPMAKEIFVKEMEADQHAYNDMVALLREDHMIAILAEINEKYGKAYADKSYVHADIIPIDTLKRANAKAEKMAIEDARYVFPNACETKIVVTMTARALMNFLRHRCCNRAQWEIRELADAMTQQLKDVAPTLFKYAGPPCLNGKCPEGSLSCGKMKEIKEKFNV